MWARVLETGPAAELIEHLGYERHAVDGHRSGNSRNGSFPKTLGTEIGEVAIRVTGIATTRSNRRWSRTGSAASTGSRPR